MEASISSHLLFQPPQMALQTCTRPFVRALMSILKSFWVENVLTWRQPVCRPARLPALPAPAWPTLLAPLCCSLDPILPALHPYGALGCAQQVWWDLVTGCQSPIWTRWLSGASLGGGGGGGLHQQPSTFPAPSDGSANLHPPICEGADVDSEVLLG